MTIQNIIDELLDKAIGRREVTVDTVKSGDAAREVKHIACCFMATAEVMEKARAMGVDFIITHEPTYYDHHDEIRDNHPIVAAKRQQVEESGITLWRYHDHIHYTEPDGICEGVIDALGWRGHQQEMCWVLDEPMSARQMAADIREKLGAGGVRVTGDLDTPLPMVAMMVGDPGFNGRMMDQIMIATQAAPCAFFCGEVCEWGVLEQVRDAAAFGMPMAALTCGHLISEEMGMRLLANRLAEAHPDIQVDFIPTGEVYSYL